MDQNCPPDNFWKTTGKLINVNPGPEVGDKPAAKTAGIIITALKTAAEVSKNSIVLTDLNKFSFSER